MGRSCTRSPPRPCQTAGQLEAFARSSLAARYTLLQHRDCHPPFHLATRRTSEASTNRTLVRRRPGPRGLVRSLRRRHRARPRSGHGFPLLRRLTVTHRKSSVEARLSTHAVLERPQRQRPHHALVRRFHSESLRRRRTVPLAVTLRPTECRQVSLGSGCSP